MSVKISLCMIAKNESDFIGNCLKSTLSYVNQIIVVDTGSSDQTPEIARKLGAEVYTYTWNNDFSAARNHSLEKATGDWILFMDCDEEIDPDLGHHLLEAVQSKDCDAYYLNVKNLLGMDHEITFQSIRLFRNLPQFRFKGKIHEQVSDAIFTHSGPGRIGRLNVTLLHHGYNPERVNISSKIIRNVGLLEEDLQDRSCLDGFYLYNVGIEYIRQGQYQKALENFIEALKVTNPNSGYAPPLVNKLLVCLIELGRYRDALDQLAYFQSLYPDYHDLFLLQAACHIQCGRFSLAADSIEKAVKTPHRNPRYPVEGKIFNQSPEQLQKQIEPYLLQKAKNFQLSVCILAKNQEKHIARCLRSVGEIADKILLIVTECSDNTLNIAYQMGANLYRLNRSDSFAQLRNFALKNACGDWILFLNGDEEINSADIAALVEGLNNSTFIGYKIRQRTFYAAANEGNYRDQAVCRLIRNEQGLCYKSRLIEDIDLSIAEKHGDTALSYLPVTVFHYGFHLKSEPEEQVFRRNIYLLSKDSRDQDKNPLPRQEMGLQLYNRGKYKAALVQFQAAHKLYGTNIPADLFCGMIKCLVKLKKYDEVVLLSKTAVDLYPDYTDLLYYQGFSCLNLGLLHAAKECFEKCLQLGSAPWEKYAACSGVGSFLPHCRLAELYLQQGNIDESLLHYCSAAQITGGADMAIPPMTDIFLSKFHPGRLLEYLQDHKLDTIRNICTAAMAANKKNCLLESLALWERAMEKLITTRNYEQYHNIAAAMFQILSDIYTEANQHNSGDTQLQSIREFFSQQDNI
ncbi:MAG: glycosyltransferase [Bacillota bacterium]|nr:glycosyltransferase [Bacillota bacterium]